MHLAFTERELRSGESFRLHYSFGAQEDLERINAYFYILPMGDEHAEIYVTRATLRISELADPQQELGLVIHHYSHPTVESNAIALNSP